MSGPRMASSRFIAALGSSSPVLVVVLLLASGSRCARSAYAVDLPFVAKTKNYVVKTDVDKDLAVRVADHLESFRKQLVKTVKLGPNAYNGVCNVAIYKEFSDYKIVLLALGKRPDRMYYDFYGKTYGNPVNTVNAFVIPEKRMMARLRGVACMQYLHESIGQVPRWIDLGLAEYFNYAQFDPAKGFSYDRPAGYIRYWREVILGLEKGPWSREAEYVKVANLMQWMGADLAPVDQMQAEIWGLIVFLLHGGGPKLKALFDQYLLCLARTTFEAANSETAYKKTFKNVHQEKLDADFVAFMRKFTYRGYDDFLAGFKAFQDKQYDQAIAALTKALEAEPEFARCYLVRGQAEEGLGKAAEALADFRKAVELEPFQGEHIFYLGRALATARLYDEADKVLDLALELIPSYAANINEIKDLMAKWRAEEKK